MILAFMLPSGSSIYQNVRRYHQSPDNLPLQLLLGTNHSLSQNEILDVEIFLPELLNCGREGSSLHIT